MDENVAMTDLLRDLEAVATAKGSFELGSAATRLAGHHAEIAEAAADARRYRWLRETNGRHFPVSVAMKLGDAITNDDFDAVVDDAMRNSEQAEDRHD